LNPSDCSAVPKERNVIAEGAIAKMLKAQPAPFMHRKNARLITAGNTEDDLEKLADVDWVIEAVIENPTIKQELYQKLDRICGPDTLISSNTSTLPLKILTAGQSDGFKHRFIYSRLHPESTNPIGNKSWRIFTQHIAFTQTNIGKITHCLK
jgi:3-hydroxyacyl-CoA dehydrogenase